MRRRAGGWRVGRSRSTLTLSHMSKLLGGKWPRMPNKGPFSPKIYTPAMPKWLHSSDNRWSVPSKNPTLIYYHNTRAQLSASLHKKVRRNSTNRCSRVTFSYSHYKVHSTYLNPTSYIQQPYPKSNFHSDWCEHQFVWFHYVLDSSKATFTQSNFTAQAG